MNVKILMLLLGFAIAPKAHAACSQTLSAGANVASAIQSAAGGSVICLNAGTYSISLNNVAKSPRVTVMSASEKSAIVSFKVTGSSSGLTFDSLTIPAASITGAAAHDITVSHSDFKAVGGAYGQIIIEGVVKSNILLDSNTHNNINITPTQSAVTGRVSFPYGNQEHSGVTVQNSEFNGGCADGIQAGVGINVYNNRFMNMVVGSCKNDPHVDAIQFVFHSGAGPHIKGNYFYNNEQSLTAFDRVANAIIEDNIFDSGPIGRPWVIEWYSDTNSIIRHNTVLYSAKCIYNMDCGHIILDHKSSDPAGKGTIVENNIATVIDIGSGTGYARMANNLVRRAPSSSDIVGVPTFVGGAAPKSPEQFKLAAGSAGVGKASDGGDIGSRVFGAVVIQPPTTTPTPVPTVTPQPTPVPTVPPVSSADQTGLGSLKPQVAADSDTASVELGVKFKSSVAGSIKAIRFYRGKGSAAGFKVSLWDSAGKRLASAVSSAGTVPGYITVNFASAVAIQANAVYTASYLASKGAYAVTNNGFSSSIVSGNLTLMSGVYAYGSGSAMPAQVYQKSNYFVDVVFAAGNVVVTPTPTPAPTVTPAPSATPTPQPTVVPSGTYPKSSAEVGVTAARCPNWANIKKSSGAITTSQAGQVIENLEVSGTIYVKHANVKIRCVKIRANDYFGVNIESSLNATIEDSEISNVAAFGIGFLGYTARRVYIHDTSADGFKAGDNTTIEYSYIERLGSDPESHADGIQLSGGSNININFNNFQMPSGNGFNNDAPIFIGPDFGNITNVMINGNRFNGGGYSINMGEKTYKTSGVVIQNNFFGRSYGYGPASLTPSTTWTNNRWEDTNAVINRP